MRFRSLLRVLLALLTVATSGLAIEIDKARYGHNEKYLDVKDLIRAYVRNNTLSFRVTKQSMGGDRNPDETDTLTIEYKVEGRRYKDRVREGDVFTFQGLSGVDPIRPFLGIIQPAAPSGASVRIVNQLSTTVLIYALDRYGRWMWQGELPGGRVFTDTGAVGQQWKVTDRTNQPVESFTLRSSGNTITLGQPSGPTRVRFENSYPYVLYVYKLDRWRNWEWVARLDPGSTYTVNGIYGETWIVIDKHGRTVRQFDVGPSTCHQRF